MTNTTSFDIDEVIEMMQSWDTIGECNNPDCRAEQLIEPDGGGHTCHECDKGKVINSLIAMGFI